jgi:hypothetical protein
MTFSTEARDPWNRWFPWLIVIAAFAMMAVLVALGRGLTFWYDEWSIVLDRPDPSIDSLLRPHVDHLCLVPVALYQLLLRVVGLHSYWPYLAISWACHIFTVVLVYRIVSRRSGAWLGLFASLSLLTLGSAFEDLLHAWQSSFLISVAFGVLAIDLLSVEQPGRQRQCAAVLALAVAIASSSVGVIFTGFVLAWGIVGRRRAFVAISLAIAAVYAGWYLTWGRLGQGPISGEGGDPLLPVAYFGFGLGSAVAAVIGLPPIKFGTIGLVVGILAGLRAGFAGGRLTAFGLAALTALLAQYALQALFRSGLGIEQAARSAYLYQAVIFLWFVVADVLMPHRYQAFGRNVRAVMALTLALAIVGNVAQLIGAGRAMFGLRATMLEELRLAQSARDVPGLALDVSPDMILMPQVTVRRYLAAVDRFGAPRLAIDDEAEGVTAAADSGTVNAAALVMLGRAFVPGGALDDVPPDAISASDGALGEPNGGCVPLVGPGAVEAHWQLQDGAGFSIHAEPATAIVLSLGVRSDALAPVTDRMAADAADGGIRPPKLPSGAPWFGAVRSDRPVTICGIRP